MQVSAISSSSCKTVFNTRVNSRGGDNYAETSFSNLNSYSKKSASLKQSQLFDSINEWKNFCHSQIEKGKFDVIA